MSSSANSNTTPRKRLACDRCHGQKLRCIRPAGSESCIRCLKARADCVFSTPNRAVKADHKPALATPPSEEDVEDECISGAANPQQSGGRVDGTQPLPTTLPNNDWFSQQIFDNVPFTNFTMDDPMQGMQGHDNFNFPQAYSDTTPSNSSASASEKEFNFQPDALSMAPNLQLAYLPQSLSGQMDMFPHGHVGKTGFGRPMTIAAPPPDNMIYFIRQLAELSISLSELISSISSGPCAGMADDSGSAQVGNAQFSMERLYTLNQNLIDLYPRFINLFAKTEKKRTAAVEVRPGSSRNRSAASVVPDLASVHLLLSCHHRMLDVYDMLTAQLQKNFEDSTAAMSATMQQACGIQIFIGTFRVSDQMSGMLQFAMLVEMSRALSFHAKQITKTVEATLGFDANTSAESSPNDTYSDRSSPSTPGSYRGDATIAACKAVGTRSRQIQQRLETLREIVPRFLDYS